MAKGLPRTLKRSRDNGALRPVNAVAVANIATANGSDAATTQALANANKAKINELLGELRKAGVIS